MWQEPHQKEGAMKIESRCGTAGCGRQLDEERKKEDQQVRKSRDRSLETNLNKDDKFM